MADGRAPADVVTRDASPHDIARMPLLERIAYETLDRDYDLAATRRANSGTERAGPQLVLRIATLVAVGVVLAVAVTQTAQQSVDEQESRPILIERVQAQRDSLAGIQSGNAELRSQIATEGTRGQAADRDANAMEQEAAGVAARTGFRAVTGPALKITVNSPEGAAPRDSVRDADLALLVNALWTAGAEAIAINGQRMTPLTYIKNSGDVVHVNSRPLTPPYVVAAIGDSGTLAARLLEAPTGVRFLDYARLLDFTVTQEQVKSLRLGAVTAPQLRTVRLGVRGDVPLPETQGVMP